MHKINCSLIKPINNINCISEYRRIDLTTNNKQLLDNSLHNWVIDFPSLDKAIVKWNISLNSKKINTINLPEPGILDKNWASKLQAILPAFTVLRLESPKKLAVQAPVDENGIAYPTNKKIPKLAIRKIKVQGPLRSAILIENLSSAVTWQKINLSYNPDVKVDIKNSSLSLNMEGIVYEDLS